MTSPPIRKEQGNRSASFRNDMPRSPLDCATETIATVGVIAVLTAVAGLLAVMILSSQQMHIIWPVLVASGVFAGFSYLLKVRAQINIFGEIGFLYLALALAYTVLPAVKFIMLDFNFPLDFDGLNFAVLAPKPVELGIHFWRHVLFITAVATGYLMFRGETFLWRRERETSTRQYDRVIALMIAVTGGCALIVTLLLPAATTYIEHYTRFDNLSAPVRKIVDLSFIFKTGGYFVLMALMFSQYRRYRILIYLIVPIVCAYEIVFSFGSRIVAFTILMSALGFYHFRVVPLSFKKSALLVSVLVILFTGIGYVRHFNYSLDDAQYNVTSEKDVQASESEAVYCTGYHLYYERAKGTLPSRDWPMFFNDFIAVIPFIDHIKHNPQYWYARNYFPQAEVPPTTMGVIANSALWGGEWDLLLRGLINGALFALLTRWFFRRQNKWWALTIYVYCYATCIMAVKYDVLFQLPLLCRMILPTVLLAEGFFRVQRIAGFFKEARSQVSAV